MKTLTLLLFLAVAFSAGAAMRERIAEQSLLFKVRVAGNRLDPRKQTL